MKVKIFSNEYEENLEADMNDWLAQYPNIEIVDIRFSSWGAKRGIMAYTFTKYIALVLYNEKK